jgi:2-dehydro-3-deoxygluconokinase
MNKVVGFGDLLVRLNPQGYLRFLQADCMQVNYTGAEANVCVSLAHMGVPTEFVTRLPQNAIADCAVAELRRHNVSVAHIARGGERIGVFYLEKGAAQRPSGIVYDRKHTAIATASADDFDWDRVFEGAGYFHITGITPALGEGSPAVCEAALKAARERGLVISCDLNYRARMWSVEQAGAVMRRLLTYVDVLIANEEDAEKVLGIRAAGSDVTGGRLNREGYVEVAQALSRMYGFRAVGITLRGSLSASDNDWSAMLYTDGHAYFSRAYRIHLVDRVGGGDSFAAGLIYGMREGFDAQKVIEFAAAASCLKQTIELDFNLCSAEEVLRLVDGDGSGRVRR